MPCDTIQTTSIDFGKADTPLLAKALGKLGWTVANVNKNGLTARNQKGESLSFRDGTFEVQGASYTAPKFDQAEVRREYSRQVVGYAAQRFGWSLKQTADNKFTATRKAF